MPGRKRGRLNELSKTDDFNDKGDEPKKRSGEKLFFKRILLGVFLPYISAL